MEIGLFQIENLALTRITFLLLDLRDDRSRPLPGPLSEGSIAVESVSSNKAINFLNQQAGLKDRPVVLLCEAGKTSTSLAQELETQGFSNVYVVAGGYEGLLLEL